jgi:hypothetical protein
MHIQIQGAIVLLLFLTVMMPNNLNIKYNDDLVYSNIRITLSILLDLKELKEWGLKRESSDREALK